MITHSASLRSLLLRDSRSRFFCTLGPPLLSSSRRSWALGNLYATHQCKPIMCLLSLTAEKGKQKCRNIQRKEETRSNSPAARPYHLLASSKLLGHPIPTSVKYPIANMALGNGSGSAVAAFLAHRYASVSLCSRMPGVPVRYQPLSASSL